MSHIKSSDFTGLRQVLRKTPLSWHEDIDVLTPETRAVTEEVDDLVEYLYNARNELCELECVEDLRDFLEDEVQCVIDATSLPFFTDTEETAVYEEIRGGAVQIEHSFYTMLQGRDFETMRHSMPQWRWNIYDDILDKTRLLSCVRGVSELKEDVDESENDDVDEDVDTHEAS